MTIAYSRELVLHPQETLSTLAARYPHAVIKWRCPKLCRQAIPALPTQRN